MSQRSGSKRNQSRKTRKSGGQRSQSTVNPQAQEVQQAATTESPRQTARKSTATRTTGDGSRRTSRKATAQAQAKKKQQMQLIIGGVVVAMIVAVAFIFINRPSNTGVEIDYTGIAREESSIVAANGTPSAEPYSTELNWATGATVGDPNAPITMHVYTDFQCHFCQRWHSETLPKIVDDFVRTGQVKIVFHDYPLLGTDQSLADPADLTVELRDGNNESSLAAQAAMCAGEQDKYVEMTERLYGNFSGVQAGAFNRDNLTRYSNDMGLDTDALNACIDSGKYIPALAASRTQGQAHGITGTPMFILDDGEGNRSLMQNTENYDTMKKQIEFAVEAAE